MKNISRIAVAEFFAAAIVVLCSCNNNKETGSTNNTDTSKKEVWAEEVHSLTWFKDDSKPTNDQHWNTWSKSIDKNKIIKTLLDAVITGKAKTYDAFTDSLIDPQEAKTMINRVDTLMKEDITTGKMIAEAVKTEVAPADIIYIAFMEDWQFDAEKFSLTKKVSKVCLFTQSFIGNEPEPVYKPLFWIKFNN